MLNPDQFSLPGLEDHAESPALARALTRGYSFSGEHGHVEARAADDLEPDRDLSMPTTNAADLWWNATNKKDGALHPGTVGLVETHADHRRQGLGEAMWDLARTGQFGRRPRHSTDRSPEGDAYARGLQAKGKGGLVPKSDREKYSEKLRPEDRERMGLAQRSTY